MALNVLEKALNFVFDNCVMNPVTGYLVNRGELGVFGLIELSVK